jgi:hypothetical protein
MLKRIDRVETKDCIYFEAVFTWGSVFAFTIAELLKELKNHNLNYSLN